MTISVNGQPVTGGYLLEPEIGAWRACVQMDKAPSGRVTLDVGGRRLSGTVDERFSRTFVDDASCVIVAGANGWGATLGPKHYQNLLGGGVRVRQVAEDAARECGETLAPGLESVRIGLDYMRPGDSLASDVLRKLAPSWWVDDTGLTHLEPRAARTAPTGIEFLDYDVASGELLAANENDVAIVPGMILRDPRFGEFVARYVRSGFEAAGARCIVGTIRHGDGAGRLVELIRAIARPTAVYGVHRCKVLSSTSTFVEVTPVNPRSPIPRSHPLRSLYGIAGAKSRPAVGSTVLVQFVDGDVEQPIITGFEGPGVDATHWPVSTSLEATEEIAIGTEADRVIAGTTETNDPGKAPGRFVYIGQQVTITGTVVGPGPGSVTGFLTLAPSETSMATAGAS